MSTPSTTTIPSPDLIDAARAAVEVTSRITDVEVTDHAGDVEAIPVVITPVTGGGYRVDVAKDVIAESERRAAGPRRRAGTVDLGSVDSLVEYVNLFKGPADKVADAVAFAPIDNPGVTVVFDYHPAHTAGLAAWCGDRAAYRCPFSRQWKLWTGADNRAQAQGAFGDFLEANQVDLTTREGFATAPQMLEVARNLAINVGSKFQRTINPTTGEGTLIVKDEHDAATSTKIPKAFALAIPVFEGDEVLYPVEALLRFAMVEGRPSFTYVLQNKEKCLEHALAQLRARVAKECGIPVFVGNPPPAAR